MLRKIHLTSSVLLTALGVVHTAMTPVFYGRFTHNALWFAGSGLAMMFVGFLNITLNRDAGRGRLAPTLCHIANLLTAVFGALIVRVNTEPQVILGFVLIILTAVTAFSLKGGVRN